MKAVEYLHSRQVAHQSLSPLSILLKADLNLIVIEFAFSDALWVEFDQIISLKSPEAAVIHLHRNQYQRINFLEELDLKGKTGKELDYAQIAAILYFMLTGEQDFQSRNS